MMIEKRDEGLIKLQFFDYCLLFVYGYVWLIFQYIVNRRRHLAKFQIFVYNLSVINVINLFISKKLNLCSFSIGIFFKKIYKIFVAKI